MAWGGRRRNRGGGRRAGRVAWRAAGGRRGGAAGGVAAAGGEGASRSGWAGVQPVGSGRSWTRGCSPRRPPRASPRRCSGGGYVIDALEAALWALRTTSTFEDGVLAAVNLGDDADTTAAIYGQLAGAIHGLEGIPERWRAKLHRGDEIVAMADALYDLDHSRPALARYAHVRPTRVVECRTSEEVAEAIRSANGSRSAAAAIASRGARPPRHADRRRPDRPCPPRRHTGDDRRRRAARRDLRHARTTRPHARRRLRPDRRDRRADARRRDRHPRRRHGLTCDELVAATVVLADGRIVHMDDHPDLLWALKGRAEPASASSATSFFTTVPGERTTVFDVIVPRTPETVAAWEHWGPARARGARREPADPRRRGPPLRRLHRTARGAERHLAVMPGDGRSRSSIPRGQAVARGQRPDDGEDVRSPAPGTSSADRLRCTASSTSCRSAAPSTPASDATAYPHRTRSSACTSKPPTRRRPTRSWTAGPARRLSQLPRARPRGLGPRVPPRQSRATARAP